MEISNVQGSVALDGKLVLQGHWPGELEPFFGLRPLPSKNRGDRVEWLAEHGKPVPYSQVAIVEEGLEKGSFVN